MGAQADINAMIQQNLWQRQMLIAQSPVFTKNVMTATNGVPGGTTRLRLYNVGLLKRIILQVSMQVDIGGATATVSNKNPWNLINRVQLVDYAGNTRINVSGAHLFEVNAARYRTYYGYNNEAAPAVFTTPQVPTAVGTNQTLSFMIEVPICYSDTDLRGLMLMQTNVGECQLNIDWNSLLVGNGNDDAVYNGGGTTTVVQTAGTYINVTMLQEYFSPQADPATNQVIMPLMDINTIYEINGCLRSSDNLINNQERLISFPNLRSVVGAYIGFKNNGLMDSANVVQHRMLVNGNNVMIERPNAFQLFEQRRWRNSDTRKGQYSLLFRDKPIETQYLGNCQWGFTPNNLSGSYDLEMTFESFFTTGATLPGLNQAQ